MLDPLRPGRARQARQGRQRLTWDSFSGSDQPRGRFGKLVWSGGRLGSSHATIPTWRAASLRSQVRKRLGIGLGSRASGPLRYATESRNICIYIYIESDDYVVLCQRYLFSSVSVRPLWLSGAVGDAFDVCTKPLLYLNGYPFLSPFYIFNNKPTWQVAYITIRVLGRCVLVKRKLKRA